MCEIEKGKGINERDYHKKGRPWKYPYNAMEIGDSFTLASKTASDISGSLTYANRKLAPALFKASLYDENGERIIKNGVGAVRVMRVE